jgi:hypothetical protein
LRGGGGESHDRTARAATSMVQMYTRRCGGQATRARPRRLGEEKQRSQRGKEKQRRAPRCFGAELWKGEKGKQRHRGRRRHLDEIIILMDKGAVATGRSVGFSYVTARA